MPALPRAGREPGRARLLRGGFRIHRRPARRPDGSLLIQDNKAEKTYRIDADGTRSSSCQRARPGRPTVRPSASRRSRYLLRAERPSCVSHDGRWRPRSRRSSRILVRRSGSTARMTSSAGPTAWSTSPIPPTAWHPPIDRSTFRVSTPSNSRHGGAGLAAAADDFEKPNGLAFSPDDARSTSAIRRATTSGLSGRTARVRLECRLDPRLRPDRSRPAWRPRRDKSIRPGGFMRRRPGDLGFRTRRPPAGILPYRPSGQPGLARPAARAAWPSPPWTASTSPALGSRASCPPSFPDFFRCKRCSILNKSIIL